MIPNAVSQRENAGFLKDKQLTRKSRKEDDRNILSLGLGGGYTGETHRFNVTELDA